MNYDKNILEAIRSAAVPLKGSASDYETLLTAIGDAQIVLLGEATHGTHEFYTIRGEITQQLITQKGFHAVAIEGDWPDAYQVNRDVHGQNHTAMDALGAFDRFPTWMWRNVPMIKFIEWMQAYNKEQLAEKR